MTMENTRRLVEATQTSIDKTTYRCSGCGFHISPDGSFAPDECPECGRSITQANRVDQTPALVCPRCNMTVPADSENRSWSSDTIAFICPSCNHNPILAIQRDGEIQSSLSLLSTKSLSLDPDDGTEFLEGVYVVKATSSDPLQAAQVLNSEAKTYDSSFTGYSVDSDDTNVMLIYTDEMVIGYVTWTRELCDDDLTRPILQQVFILEDYWRQGIGDALIEHVLDDLPNGDEAVWLNSPNVHMVNVLDRLGLVELNDKGNGINVQEDRIGITGSSIVGLKQYIQKNVK